MKTLWQQIFQYGLALIITIGFFTTIGLLIFGDLSDSVQDALLILLGVLAGAFSAVVQYFFGSSKGSSDKNELLNNPRKEVITD